MNVSFRCLTVPGASDKDIQTATKIINEANAKYVRIFPGERLDNYPLRSFYEKYDLVIAEVDSTIAAVMTVIDLNEGLKVELLAVDLEFHGKGLGPKMLDEATRIAKSRGLSTVWLEVVEQGTLVSFYIRNGFTEKMREVKPEGFWLSTEPFTLVTMSRPIL